MVEPATTGASAVLATLAQLPIATHLSEARLAALASACRLEDLDVGARLFASGDAADELFIVTSGRICLCLDVPGRAALVVSAHSRGDIFGWEALREGELRFARAEVSKAARCLRCSGSALLELCAHDHELGYQIMSHAFMVVSQSLEDCRVQLLDVYGSRRP